jgi:hypothetical protein
VPASLGGRDLRQFRVRRGCISSRGHFKTSPSTYTRVRVPVAPPTMTLVAVISRPGGPPVGRQKSLRPDQINFCPPTTRQAIPAAAGAARRSRQQPSPGEFRLRIHLSVVGHQNDAIWTG